MPWQVVDRIVSGNVIDVRGAGLVRLAGIEDDGEIARAFLAGLISSQAVRVVASAYSSAGMTEAFVYVPDGRCVNVEMLRFGYARARITPNFERRAEFLGLQQDAQRLGRGLWAPAAPAVSAPAAAPGPAFQSRTRRGHAAIGGGAGLDGDRRDWIAMFEAGVFPSRAVGLYLSAGYIRDLGDASTAGADRAWHGGGGMILTLPAESWLRPYARAGGGYMRIETRPAGEIAKRDRPFWEAGAGLIISRGPVHTDIGYVYARVDGHPVSRAFGLFGIRF